MSSVENGPHWWPLLQTQVKCQALEFQCSPAEDLGPGLLLSLRQVASRQGPDIRL